MRFTTVLAALAATATAQFSSDPNAACGVQAIGYAPPTPGSADQFRNNPAYSALANFAVTPSGYTRSFANLKGATSGGSYLGFVYQQSYNTTGCAALCKNTNGCVAFNTYIERDPLLNPADACPNPPSTANYKCSFWGQPVTANNATNTGQFRNQFEVAIAASNGYNRS